MNRQFTNKDMKMALKHKKRCLTSLMEKCKLIPPKEASGSGQDEVGSLQPLSSLSARLQLKTLDKI